MKFLYRYKTSDGERHEGVCTAPSKDEVFVRLKKEGVKPFDVRLAPGVFNRLQSYGKRGLTIAVLVCLCGGLAFAMLRLHSTSQSQIKELSVTFDSHVRRQILGDEAIVDQGVRTGWANVFTRVGDRFLASYAIPGVMGAVARCTLEELEEAISASEEIPYATIEERQIVAMVAGLKEEARRFVAAGGTLQTYSRRLVQRQQEEIGYYNRAKNEVDQESKKGNVSSLSALLGKRNDELRRLGLRPLLMPEMKGRNSPLTRR